MASQGFPQRVTVAALLVGTAILATVRAAETPADWLRGSGKDLQIRVRGEVLNPDGQPADAIEVTGRLNGTAPQSLKPTANGHEFEIWIPVNQQSWHSMWIKAAKPDGNGVAYAKLGAYQLRQAAVDGIKLTLQPPTRHVEVKITDAGQPVADAHVKADVGYGIELRARTDADGIARFGLLPDQKLSSLSSWTDDHRIGGYSFDRKPTRDPDANQQLIELSRCRDQKFRFIDEAGAPVPGVDFVLQLATAPPDYNYIGANEHSRMTTDESGEVVYRWFPDWKEHHFYVDLNSPDWYVEGDPELLADAAVFTLKKSKPRHQVAGRVTAKDADVNAGGFYVMLESFQAERENYIDQRRAFANPDGTFALEVLPDATYCGYALDAHWVGEMIDLIPYQSRTEQTSAPELPILKGEPVEVQVTTGPQQKPYENLTVSFRREHSFNWIENGKSRGGTASAQWWATTDDAGIARTHTLPGKLSASVYTPIWRTEQIATVAAGEPARINLHRDIEDYRTVTGRLALAGGADSTLAGAEVHVGSVDGDYSFEKKLAANADGAFSVETVATAMGVFAQTKDGQAAGVTVANDLTKPIAVQLRPTLEFHGQLLGQDDHPLAAHGVHAVVRVEGDEDHNGLFLKSFDAKRIKTKTDDQGAFHMAGVPAEMKVVLFADRADGSTDSHYLGDFFLEPNDARPPMVFRIKPADESAPVVPLAERYEKALRDGRLSGYHVMVLLSSGGDHVAEFIDNNFVDYRKNKDVSAYMQILVQPAKDGLDPADAAFLAQRSWQLPDDGRVLALALDGQGQELGRLELAVADNAAAQQAADFIHQHAPAQLDAEEKWNHAFAEAAASDRRVWVRVSQRYCGPCFMLTRWLDDHRELLAKDYVMLKIDDVRDKSGREVADRLTRGENHGVPFHAIFDQDEQLAIDSAGPLGNIGYPSGFEGKKHLRKMLLATRQNLTDAEIDQIVNTLSD